MSKRENVHWTDAQQKVIDARNSNLLVSAAAGSGKTAVLVERIIQMISNSECPIDLDKLLVVTFTKAAAAQMKDKIVDAIEQLLIEQPENEHYLRQMDLTNHANIMTIDSFCYQIVKEHFYALSIDPEIRIGDNGEIGLLREEILEQTIELFYRDNADFVAFSDAYSSDKNDSRVEEIILQIYNVSSSYPRPEIWTKRARELFDCQTEESLSKLLVMQDFLREIHNLACGVKETIQNTLKYTQMPNGPYHLEKTLLLDSAFMDDIMMANSYSRLQELKQEGFKRIATNRKGDYDKELENVVKGIRDQYKKRIAVLLDVCTQSSKKIIEQIGEQKAMFTALLDAVDYFRMQFLQAKLDSRILEFSDVEHFALQVLCKGYDEHENPIPSDIGLDLSEDFEEILIDEYQDSNYLQEAILNCVSKVSQGKNNIFMVGDVKQSIYGFRMARPDLFMDKYHTYEAEDGAVCRKILLKNNFRSRANVLEAINYIFYQIMGADLGGIDYTQDESLIPGRTFLESEDDCVELLMGESQNFEFLSDRAVIGEKEEHLDEELEDIGKIELEATMVANRILEMLGANGKEPFQIMSESGDGMRPVSCRDIVILFRAPRAFQRVFSEVLLAKGLPVKVQNENGYLDRVEIQMLLSLLYVLDNPLNDVEMAAAMRSFFGKCDNNDLAILSVLKRKMTCESLYKIVEILSVDKISGDLQQALCDMPKEMGTKCTELIAKCKQFMKILECLKVKMHHESAADILHSIYYETGYYYYVRSMPDGINRARNLVLFLRETSKIAGEQYCSIFELLRYVHRMQEKAIPLGGDPTNDSDENVIRIMSIHKSKGLEFPVVFLSGMGKDFNLKDTKQSIIVHSDYYIGAKYFNLDKRCGGDTFIRQAMCAMMQTANIAEELRVLYVGMTRAKEKLIMTGVTKDIPALVKKFEAVSQRREQKLSYGVVKTTMNYLELVVAALIRNEDFMDAMHKVRARIDKKDGSVISAHYNGGVMLKEPRVRFRVMAYDYLSILVSHLESSDDQYAYKMQNLTDWEKAPAACYDTIAERLTWQYKNEMLTKQSAKLSVTEIKRMYENDTVEEFVNAELCVEGQNNAYRDVLKPKFIAEQQSLTAAQKGTYIHKAMEMFAFDKAEDINMVRVQLEGLFDADRLPKQAQSFITVDMINQMVNSSLGKRMRIAARDERLYKEQQFVVGVPQSKISRCEMQEASKDLIVVQGIIDAFFEEQGELVLVDYKTDQIQNGQEAVLVERYRTQMRYYKETLEQLKGMSVKESYIYSFALGKEILIEL